MWEPGIFIPGYICLYADGHVPDNHVRKGVDVKMQKTLRSFLMTFLLVLCFSVTASATPKLSQRKATLTVGQKITLRVKNRGKKKVKWSSSNKKVATVSSKGKVKAKRKGTAVITAKTGEKKLKCRVTVRKAPSGSGTRAGSVSDSSGVSDDFPAVNRPGTAPVPMTVEETAVYNKMTALRAKYPTGYRWTNEIYYSWKGGIYRGGFGCAAFAFILSDEAFGNSPAGLSYDFSNIRIGDILRVYNNSHVVIVLGKYMDGSLLIAEGNSGREVYWGRVMSGKELQQINAVITRW